MYFIKTPSLLKALYPQCIWDISSKEKLLYLTFDDGPHPEITLFVLDQLKKFQAQASFFCIGNNVASYPNVYERILAEGHVVGNHTYDHLNGWKTKTSTYLDNIKAASTIIHSPFFRPPYGRIRRSAIKQMMMHHELPHKIIMWDVLSGDFDLNIEGEQCTQNVIQHAVAGSIIVFHDSVKAWDRLSVALPHVLEHFTQLGFTMKGLP